MHARFEHLLSLRDGAPVDMSVRMHVDQCSECRDALGGSVRLRDRLRALPAVEPATAEQWTALRARLASPMPATKSRSSVALAGLAAAAVLCALGLAWRASELTASSAASIAAAVTPLTAEEAIVADRVAQLQTQSAALEEVLAVLGAPPAIERAGTAVPIDTLEAQVLWIDHQLSGSGGSARDAEPLWRERVKAMNSLVRLRYVEAQRIAM